MGDAPPTSDNPATPDEVVEAFEQGLAEATQGYGPLFEAAQDEQSLRAANARWVGPQGKLTGLMKLMPRLPADRRRELGQRANRVKGEIGARFQARLEALARDARDRELTGPHLDITLPGRGPRPGRLHPLTRVKHELLDIFVSLGFQVAEGPEVEWHEYNFDCLGFPPEHPATDMQDSFFISGQGGDPRATLLRTHTSNMQVRELRARKPPLAVVSPGAVYRRDDDATHSPMFMQIEGFIVDEGIRFPHLKGVLTAFLQQVFGNEVPVRFRPSYFPFVEPGGEVDIGRVRVAADGSRQVDWMEVLGCGMIHPVVLERAGLDPERFTGFAFGLGVDRMAMLRYGIPNIRLMYDNDPRFLGQI